MALPEPVDVGSLQRIIQALQDNLKSSARQGADEKTALDSQFIGIGEEAGEALGAYRRWRGFARRAGSAQEVYDELADVLIVTLVGIIHFAEVNGDNPDPEEIIEQVLTHKLDKIFSRGWVNKDDTAIRPNDSGNGTSGLGSYDMAEEQRKPIADRAWNRLPPNPTLAPSAHRNALDAALDAQAAIRPEDNPDAVYVRQPDGAWKYAGQVESFDWGSLTPPYAVATGHTLATAPWYKGM
jgi:NTP pyrophosphatase (non-canonical NTP hydrolase)